MSGCFNKLLVVYATSGFFTRFLFGGSRALSAIGLGNQKYIRAGVTAEILPFIKDNTILFIKRMNNRKAVVGVRSLNSEELKVCRDAQNQKRTLLKTEESRVYVERVREVIDLKRNIYSKINEDLNYRELVWLYMKGLHIHRKYYIRGHLAWGYADDALVSLCENCHRDLHSSSAIAVYNSDHDLEDYYSNCKRCHGMGFFPEFSPCAGWSMFSLQRKEVRRTLIARTIHGNEK
tara:strand:- start:380 stop:1081 length:702 start_codon:yes stop_codon:yes gene_type:complete